MLRILCPEKIHWPQPGLNPQISDLEVRSLPRDHQGRQKLFYGKMNSFLLDTHRLTTVVISVVNRDVTRVQVVALLSCVTLLGVTPLSARNTWDIHKEFAIPAFQTTVCDLKRQMCYLAHALLYSKPNRFPRIPTKIIPKIQNSA